MLYPCKTLWKLDFLSNLPNSIYSQSGLLDYVLGTEQSESCGVIAKNPKLRNAPTWFQLRLILPSLMLCEA